MRRWRRKYFPGSRKRCKKPGKCASNTTLLQISPYYVMRHHYDMWLLLEQQLQPTEDLRARFYLRDA